MSQMCASQLQLLPLIKLFIKTKHSHHLVTGYITTENCQSVSINIHYLASVSLRQSKVSSSPIMSAEHDAISAAPQRPQLTKVLLRQHGGHKPMSSVVMKQAGKISEEVRSRVKFTPVSIKSNRNLYDLVYANILFLKVTLALIKGIFKCDPLAFTVWCGFCLILQLC